ncbi:MAG: hypothetical protein M3545_08130 [Acidobacteriota bacterium]|nr:hypothetical protein [Acidobacteriota bacterium]
MALVLVHETQAGQAAPLARPAEAIKIPDGEVSLGSVRLPTAVMADGKRLDPGTYRLRLTGETAAPPDVVGQTKKLERWVEFLKESKVVGRAVASIVPEAAIKEVAESTPPKSGAHRVERLKGGDYLRIWVNKGGDHVLLHLPLASGA